MSSQLSTCGRPGWVHHPERRLRPLEARMLWRSASQPGRIVTTEARCLNANWTWHSFWQSRSGPEVQHTCPRRPRSRRRRSSTAASPRPIVPFKSPTYPPRVHFAERAELEERLRSIEERLQAVRQKLDAMGTSPARAGSRTALLPDARGARPGRPRRSAGFRWRPARSTTRTRSGTRRPWPPSSVRSAAGRARR